MRSVISTYPDDCSGEVSAITLSPSRRGRANSSPEMYWELILPGSSYTPARSGPRSERGSLSPLRRQPFSERARQRAAMGRSGSRPAPPASACAHSAAATGRTRRAVVPLSPKKRAGRADAPCGRGVMRRPDGVRTADAPRAAAQATVASISCENEERTMSVGPSLSAAARMARCASDLEGMASSVPRSGPGDMVARIRHPSPVQKYA